MGLVLILAEKPSQAAAYSQAFQVANRTKTEINLKPCSTFPEGATITWGIGHLVSLKMPNEYKKEWGTWDLKNLPIIPEQFEFKVTQDKKVQFNAVKKLFKEADVIINACDIDREGSNIFYSIYHMTGVKNKVIKRLWINSLEIDEVQKGFANLQDNQKDLLMYREAKTRQISDWLVGMNASQLYTLLLKEKGLNTTLSVGRVQSPTVYMIYQRQKEIENFVSKPFFELFSLFKSSNGEYLGKAKFKFDTKDELLNTVREKGLESFSNNEGIIKFVSKKEKRIKSPKLHSLSTLQTTANKKWKYSPASVLEIMQSLYEKKFVTYPRTDCNYITENEFSYLVQNITDYQKIIGADFNVVSLEKQKRFVDGSKVQEHFAIIMTKKVPSTQEINSLSNDEKNIYFEILKTTLSMFHQDYIYEETKVITDVKTIEFETTGKIEKEKGWQSLFLQENSKEEKTDANKVLPSVSEGEKVLSLMEVKEGHTQPPKPYTEGALINMMKTCGKQVDDEVDSDMLKEIEGLGTEATRSGIIETIKKNGYIEVKKNIVSVTDKGFILCEAIQGNLLSSPSMTAKWETYLKKIGEGQGSQDAFINNILKFLSATIEDAPKKLQSTNIQTAVKEQQAAQYIADCPSCTKGKLVDKKTFISCSEYKNGCKFSISKTIAKKKLTDKNIKDLLANGKTAKIKGFKSKADKPFDAALVIKDGKIEFAF